jgi:hypothetical protein
MRVSGWIGGAIGLFVGGCGSDDPRSSAKHVGKACVMSVESNPTFAGFGVEEVTVEGANPGCGSGVCLVNHFQGRASCPYGQTDDDALLAPQCFTPGRSDPVVVPVAPQVENRQSEVAVTCSCRCAGPGGGPFCSCPSGYECLDLIPAFPFASAEGVAGSYCVASGTRYTGIPGLECDRQILNCETP